MSYKRVLLAAAFIALTALAGAWSSFRAAGSSDAPPRNPFTEAEPDPPTIGSPREAQLASRAEANSAATSVAPAAPMPDLPPLPEPTAPLAESLSELIDRAEGGDPAAGCRLALESRFCSHAAEFSRVAGEIEDSVVTGQGNIDDATAARLIASSEFGAAQAASRCGELDPASLPDTGRLLGSLASRLSPRQKLVLAMTRQQGEMMRVPRSGMPPPFTFTTGHLISQFFADHDLEFIEAGVHAFDPLSLEALMLLHRPTAAGAGLRFSLPDPRRFAWATLMLQRVTGSDELSPVYRQIMDDVMRSMTPEEVAALMDEVERDAVQWTARARTSRPLPDKTARAGDPSMCGD